MKNLTLFFGLFLISSSLFAKNEVTEETNVTETADTCCTATLTYNGRYYDHETSCFASFTYEQNCSWARSIVLSRNPSAKISLEQNKSIKL